MSVRPKIHHYLVHQETGQRYPVAEEVVIGRSAGDIVFNDDIKLSSQHCRILRTPQGLGIHDLGSSNGTYVDSVRLNPEKIYAFKANSLLTLGEQIFKLQEANITRKKPLRKRRRRKRKQENWDAFSIFASILALASILFWAHMYLNAKGARQVRMELPTPFSLVEKEMKATFNDYAEMGRAHSAKQLSDKALAAGLRKNLIPRLNAAYEKLGVLKPSGEFEKRKLAANRKLVMALRDQVGAMASFAETKSPKFAKELERFSAAADKAAEEARQYESPRVPANN